MVMPATERKGKLRVRTASAHTCILQFIVGNAEVFVAGAKSMVAKAAVIAMAATKWGRRRALLSANVWMTMSLLLVLAGLSFSTQVSSASDQGALGTRRILSVNTRASGEITRRTDLGSSEAVRAATDVQFREVQHVGSELRRPRTMQERALGGGESMAKSKKQTLAKRAYASDSSLQSGSSEGEERYIVLLDLWERLVNFRKALIGVLYIANSKRAVVVKPFVFNSMVSFDHSAPEHFRVQNDVRAQHTSTDELDLESSTVQTLDAYFDSQELVDDGVLCDYGHWTQHASLFTKERIHNLDGELVPSWRTVTFVSAVVLFVWAPTRDAQIQRDVGVNSAVWWCDEEDVKMKSANPTSAYDAKALSKHGTAHLRMLSEHVVYERVMCVDGVQAEHARAHVLSAMIDHMFAMAKAGTRTTAKDGRELPVTLAFRNYRKHGFRAFVQFLRFQSKFKDGLIDSKLRLSSSAISFARILLREHECQTTANDCAKIRYVAVHFRAGRAMVSFAKEANPESLFAAWASKCIVQLQDAARSAAESLMRDLQASIPSQHLPDERVRVKYYLATDLLNDGMRGGEHPKSKAMKESLSVALSELLAALGGNDTVVFNPSTLPLRSDADLMGLASLTDLAACAVADRFVTLRDSFGTFAIDQRRFYHGTSSSSTASTVSCTL